MMTAIYFVAKARPISTCPMPRTLKRSLVSLAPVCPESPLPGLVLRMPFVCVSVVEEGSGDRDQRWRLCRQNLGSLVYFELLPLRQKGGNLCRSQESNIHPKRRWKRFFYFYFFIFFIFYHGISQSVSSVFMKSQGW